MMPLLICWAGSFGGKALKSKYLIAPSEPRLLEGGPKCLSVKTTMTDIVNFTMLEASDLEPHLRQDGRALCLSG